MKILIVSARLPFPLDTGAKIRAYHILKALSQVFQITLLTFYGSIDEEPALEHLKQLGIRVIPVLNQTINKGLSIRSLIKSSVTIYPYTVEKYNHPAFRTQLTAELQKRYDIIHCEHLHMAHYLDRTNQCKKVLDAHNVESEIVDRFASLESAIFKKMALRWHYRKTLHYETECLKKFDLVMAVSEKDRDTLFQLSGKRNIRTVENGVDMEYFVPDGDADSDNLVFVGSMDWMPNDDGIRYFADEILPLICQKNSKVTVCIVGRKPSQHVRELAKRSRNIIVTGAVDDVRPFIQASAVYIVPLRIGGGTRLKILEAFAMKKAVVSTSLGCEGIDCTNGENILVADSPEAFAKNVLNLLANRELCNRLGENALELAKAKYSWETIGAKAISFYRELV